MVSSATFWFPVLLTTALVFVANSIAHMVSRYHRSDFHRLAKEDAVRDALHPLDIPPGNYVIPLSRVAPG